MPHYQSRTVVTLARYQWSCPDCGTPNTTDRDPAESWPRGRCGHCHRLHHLSEPPAAPPKKARRS